MLGCAVSTLLHPSERQHIRAVVVPTAAPRSPLSAPQHTHSHVSHAEDHELRRAFRPVSRRPCLINRSALPSKPETIRIRSTAGGEWGGISIPPPSTPLPPHSLLTFLQQRTLFFSLPNSGSRFKPHTASASPGPPANQEAEFELNPSPDSAHRVCWPYRWRALVTAHILPLLRNVHQVTTLLGTPVDRLVDANIRSAKHVPASQCMKA